MMGNRRITLRLMSLLVLGCGVLLVVLAAASAGQVTYAASEGRQIDFTPHITPLVIPTISTQPFGQEPLWTPGGSIASTPMPQSGDSGFDPEDPLDWFAAIELLWPNVDVITCVGSEIVPECLPWTAREAKLVFNTLHDYVLGQYLDGQVLIIRTSEADWSGLMAPTNIEGHAASEVWLSDHAWRTPPAAGLFDIFDTLFRKEAYFQGTFAHELTHAAVRFHPELLDAWEEAKAASGVELEAGDWRVGWMYDWSVYDEFQDDPELYADFVEGELFALTVAALMYDPWWNQGSR